MHIAGLRSAVAAQPATLGKSNEVPPGLAKRDPGLPPGIAKKLANGGIMPPGIAKRFPAPTPSEAPPTDSADSSALVVSVTTTEATATLLDILV